MHKLSGGGRLILLSYAVLFTAAAAAFLSGARKLGLCLSLPALLMSGWAFFGHLVTIDDDKPGGWSNPGESVEHWRLSLLELLIKLACFFAFAVLVLTQA